jgi:GntR family transcriptional regulator, uxu operon transcriptional repressor
MYRRERNVTRDTLTSPLSSKVTFIAQSSDSDATVPDPGRNDGSVAERSYQRLANEILKLITSGALKANDRLPSERLLAERFGVSRASVREAIIALEIRGIVEVRIGSGIYVRALKPSSFMTEASMGPFELLRGRLIIEPEICAAAAAGAKDADFDAIYTAIVSMRNTIGDKRANEIADRSFHVAIASATGNGMLARIVAGVWDRRRGPMWEKIEEHFHTPRLREASIDDHLHIFNALVARDSIAAKTRMHKHIERVIREFGKAW